MWKRGETPTPTAIVVAHRGGALLGAGDLAATVDVLVGLGVEMLEFDVRMTADDVLVVHHDANRDDMELCKHTYAELTAGGRSLIKLDDFLRGVAGRLALDVELKETGYESKVMSTVLAHASTERIVVTSFHDDALRAVRHATPSVATGLLVGGLRGLRRPRILLGNVFPFGRFVRCDADFLASSYRLLVLTGLMRRARRHRVGVVVWTVNDSKAYGRLRRMSGVLGIVTDSVDLMKTD
jgi:glycerophosphoryl diester phosphodiesterase